MLVLPEWLHSPLSRKELVGLPSLWAVQWFQWSNSLVQTPKNSFFESWMGFDHSNNPIYMLIRAEITINLSKNNTTRNSTQRFQHKEVPGSTSLISFAVHALWTSNSKFNSWLHSLLEIMTSLMKKKKNTGAAVFKLSSSTELILIPYH